MLSSASRMASIYPALLAVRTFCTVSSRADTARTRRRLLRLCARSRFAPRARRAAGARHSWPGCGRCGGCVREREARIMRSRPPNVKPAGASRSVRPLRACSLRRDRHGGKRVTSGGAGRIGSKRLDPGAPAAPRPAIAGRPGPAVGDTCLPLSPLVHRTVTRGHTR